MRTLDNSEFVVATHNSGKLAEIRELVAPFGLKARSAADLDLPEPTETGTTFEENAYTKAFAAAVASGLPALSDDSGLCVDALGGAPGVHTADWAECPDGSRDFQMAMKKVEFALREKGAIDRSARTGRFVAVLCLAWPDGGAEYFRGEVNGSLVWPPRRPVTTSAWPSRVTSTASGATPGSATTIESSSPLSKTSMGASQVGRPASGRPTSKKWACRRSARPSSSQAWAHIEERGSRDLMPFG
jgi:XTP/dITP diphosphohydrolase